MNGIARKLASVSLMCVLGFALASCEADGPDRSDSRVAPDSRVIGQALASLAIRGAPADLIERLGSLEGGIAMTSIPSNCPAVQLYQASASEIPHRVIVAQSGAEIFFLGGFSSPDVIRLLSSIPQGSRRQCSQPAELARLLDPFGLIQVILPAASQQDAPASVAEWQNQRGDRMVPSDTTMALPQGGQVVRLTVVTRTGGSAPQWVPAIYVFVYDRQGVLVAWERKLGAEIGP